jgi:hypothetical protein
MTRPFTFFAAQGQSFPILGEKFPLTYTLW